MNEWLIGALVLLVAILPLLGVCVFAGAVDGLVALQVAGTTAALILFLLSEGIQRQGFADLAIVLALLSFGGSLAFSHFLERVRQ
jgi:multisubunit Na+/H+ antiporter MnhF subunit